MRGQLQLVATRGCDHTGFEQLWHQSCMQLLLGATGRA